MNFKFYIKKENDSKWHEISDIDLQHKLYCYASRASPFIKRLLKDKIVFIGEYWFKVVEF